MPKKSGLGRGLEALFNDNAQDSAAAVEIRLSEIEPNRNQPRKSFDQQALDELSDNIVKYGLLQPLIVRPMPGGGYQIVAGERRWRACRQAGVESVPVIVKELNDSETMELALIENLQREDLNPMEESEGYKFLMNTYSLTQEEIAGRVGKSRPAVANALRLLELGEYAELVRDGKISAGHGRALLAFETPESRKIGAEAALGGASVRRLEEMAKQFKKQTGSHKIKIVSVSPYSKEVELALSEELGRRVKVTEGARKGVLEIEFYGQDDLKELVHKFWAEK